VRGENKFELREIFAPYVDVFGGESVNLSEKTRFWAGNHSLKKWESGFVSNTTINNGRVLINDVRAKLAE
jgi:hypothetical protein